MCLNNCSNNGNCTESGLCSCFTNYYGVDCSTRITDPPTLVTSSYTNNVFDLSTGSFKDVILQVKTFASDTGTAVVNCKVLNPAQPSSYINSSSLQSFALNSNLVYVNLTDVVSTIKTDYYFLNMSVSNDNVKFSSSVTLVVYDTKAYNCDSSSLTCTKIVSSLT
jgi:hypothetical protein